MSDIREYFDSLRGKRIAVVGMGVSNTPLIRMLLRADLDVTVCDRAQRERVEEQAEELESLGARLRLGEAYLEGLDQDVLEGAIHAISQADVLIIGGTSLTVYPAAGLIRYYRGKKLVLINRDETPYDSEADLVIREPIGEVFGQI